MEAIQFWEENSGFLMFRNSVPQIPKPYHPFRRPCMSTQVSGYVKTSFQSTQPAVKGKLNIKSGRLPIALQDEGGIFKVYILRLSLLPTGKQPQGSQRHRVFRTNFRMQTMSQDNT